MTADQYTTDIDIVGNAIQELLPTLNEGFNWDMVIEQYDEDPVGMAMGVFFTDQSGQEPVERVFLGVSEGPKIVMLDGLDERWEYIGSIVTYQNYGLRILDPDDDMTPDRARYQYGGVSIHPESGHSRERVWMVISNVLEVMLESIVYQQNQQAAAREGGD